MPPISPLTRAEVYIPGGNPQHHQYWSYRPHNHIWLSGSGQPTEPDSTSEKISTLLEHHQLLAHPQRPKTAPDRRVTTGHQKCGIKHQQQDSNMQWGGYMPPNIWPSFLLLFLMGISEPRIKMFPGPRATTYLEYSI